MARGLRVCRHAGSCLYNRTAAIWVHGVCVDLWDRRWEIRAEVWKCLSGRRGRGTPRANVWEGWGSKTPVVIKRAKFDCVRANVPLSYDCMCLCLCVCVCVCVQLSENSNLSLPPVTADYWRCTWPVEVHLGSRSHLSWLRSGLKLFWGLLIRSLVKIVLNTPPIYTFYNVLTLVNQLVRMLYPHLKTLMEWHCDSM